MDLYPAIDIRDGGAVRLSQGDFERQQTYGDPVELAIRFAAAGAPWLHVVDLDAARSGKPVNRPIVLEIAGSVDIPVQTGGGVRSLADIEELVDGGIRRVVLGTAVHFDPAFVAAAVTAFPGSVAVGLDYRVEADGRAEVAVRGWEHGSGRSVGEVLGELADLEISALIVTAIERDGMLSGPDLDGLRAVLGLTSHPVIASGGVSSTADLRRLARLDTDVGGLGVPFGAAYAAHAPDTAHAPDAPPRRLAGAIVGKALVEGRLTVEEGVEACAQSG